VLLTGINTIFSIWYLGCVAMIGEWFTVATFIIGYIGMVNNEEKRMIENSIKAREYVIMQRKL